MVVCYPQPGKAKSLRLLEAFARGAGDGVIEHHGRIDPLRGPAAFYGVVGLEPLWREVLESGHPYYYMDNAFFDRGRGTHYRVGRSALQDLKPGPAAWDRLAALEIGIQPWQRGGRHVVVCVQSDHFMREVARWPGGAVGWQRHVLEALRPHTDRPIVVRLWQRDKDEQARTLRADLQNAWALVTHMSAAANEAILAGVPVFVTGECAALQMGLSQLEQIESPRRPDGRREWAAMLAGKQWTEDELRTGVAWRALHDA